MEQGWGSVSLEPEPRYDGKYYNFVTVTLTPVPAAGYVFDRWEGPVQVSEGKYTVYMDGHRTVTAHFTPSDDRYLLSVNHSPSQSGSVSMSPRPPDDGYPVNTKVTVSASPTSLYAFSHWQGDLGGTSRQASIVMDRNKSVTAVFNPAIVTSCDPAIGGILTLDPPQGSAGYSPGTSVTVTATAAEGYRFDRWSGDIPGTGNRATITMDGPKTVTAHFVEASSSFPWLWIGIGLAILLAVFIVIRLARLARARTEY